MWDAGGLWGVLVSIAVLSFKEFQSIAKYRFAFVPRLGGRLVGEGVQNDTFDTFDTLEVPCGLRIGFEAFY